jgi:hypothetical protein
MYGIEERCIWGFGGRTEGKTQLGRSRCRWEDNVKTYFKEREWEVMDWINLAHNGETWAFM